MSIESSKMASHNGDPEIRRLFGWIMRCALLGFGYAITFVVFWGFLTSLLDPPPQRESPPPAPPPQLTRPPMPGESQPAPAHNYTTPRPPSETNRWPGPFVELTLLGISLLIGGVPGFLAMPWVRGRQMGFVRWLALVVSVGLIVLFFILQFLRKDMTALGMVIFCVILGLGGATLGALTGAVVWAWQSRSKLQWRVAVVIAIGVGMISLSYLALRTTILPARNSHGGKGIYGDL